MDRCSDRRPISELDPVTFFIITLMAVREQREALSPIPKHTEASADLLSQVA
jgi:hypothetical protein